MKLNLRRKHSKAKSRLTSKRSTFVTKPFQTLRANRRAINAVLSNIILIAAVIAVGFAVLLWSQYQSANYQMQYSDDVNRNIAQVQEKVIFEYIVPVGSELRVFVLNCGIQNVTIQDVYVNTNQHFTGVTLTKFGRGATADNMLNVGEQAYFTIYDISGSSPYLVKIVTEGGSTFVGSS